MSWSRVGDLTADTLERFRQRHALDHEPELPSWCAGRWRRDVPVPCDRCGVLIRELEDHTLEHVREER